MGARRPCAGAAPLAGVPRPAGRRAGPVRAGGTRGAGGAVPRGWGGGTPRVLPDARAEQNDPRRLVLELAVGALGGDVDRADLLRRLPEDYYDEEGVEELRGRFAEAADEHEVYREILEEVAGVAIDVSGRGEQAGG